MTGGFVSEDLCAALATRQLPNGGWPALSSSSQSSVEASALAHLALASDSGLVGDQATTFLLNVQNPNGSWPAFVGDDHPMARSRDASHCCKGLFCSGLVPGSNP